MSAAATLVMIHKAQHSPENPCRKIFSGETRRGIGMVIIGGAGAQRSRNTPPATMVPEIASSMQTR